MTFTRVLEKVLAAVNRCAEQGIQDALDALLQLPSWALADSGASRSRSRRIRTRLQRIHDGENVDVPATDTPHRPRQAHASQHKLAAHMHRQLMYGNVKALQ